MSSPVFDDDVARRYAVDVVLATKRLLGLRQVTTGPNPAIKPVDMWPRLESALVQAATGSRDFPEFCTALLHRLQRTTPSKAWSRLINSLAIGETVEEQGVTVTRAEMALAQPENWRRFKRVVRVQATFVMVEAQLENEQAWTTRRWKGDEE